MQNRGLSTIVSALLLIMLAVIMSGIIIVWSKGITGEAITINGENVELVCYNVFFVASYDEGILSIINDGNVKIHNVKLIMHDGIDSDVQDIKELSSKWPENGLNQGEIFVDSINMGSDIKELTIFPVLIGDEESKRHDEYLCEHKGIRIKIN